MKALLSISSVLASLLALALWSTLSERAPGSPARESSSGSLADNLVTTGSDLVGALVFVGSRNVYQIEQLVFGANSQWCLAPVYARLVSPNGDLLELDTRHRARAIFDDVAAIGGCYLTFQGTTFRLWVDRVQLALDEKGHLALASYDGYLQTGEPTRYMATLFDVPECQWMGSFTCESNPSTPCHQGGQDACPEDPPCDCGVVGNGTCDLVYKQTCPADGYCPEQDEDCGVRVTPPPPACLCLQST